MVTSGFRPFRLPNTAPHNLSLSVDGTVAIDKVPWDPTGQVERVEWVTLIWVTNALVVSELFWVVADLNERPLVSLIVTVCFFPFSRMTIGTGGALTFVTTRPVAGPLVWRLPSGIAYEAIPATFDAGGTWVPMPP